MKYVARLLPYEHGIEITFPDIGICTCAESRDDAEAWAQDLLTLWAEDYTEETAPKAHTIEELRADETLWLDRCDERDFSQPYEFVYIEI